MIDTGDLQLASNSVGQTVGIYGLAAVWSTASRKEWNGWMAILIRMESSTTIATSIRYYNRTKACPPSIIPVGFAPLFNPATARGVPRPLAIGLLASAVVCGLGFRFRRKPGS